MLSKLPNSIGIIGGGQLARMLILEMKKFDLSVTVLDPDPNAPAITLADKHIQAEYNDPKALLKLLESCDRVTFDLENIELPVDQLGERRKEQFFPRAETLMVIRDKLEQKKFLQSHRVPTARFWEISSADLRSAGSDLPMGIPYPFVHKTRTGGYDGRGVARISSEDDLLSLFPVSSYVEECVEIKKELAVMVARSESGEIKSYPVVEMRMHSRDHVLDRVTAPAEITSKIERAAKKIARTCVEKLEGVGVFGIELFLTIHDEVLVNEIAPRVHNSGHYTLEACACSQFEQHTRAIMGLPLGSTQLLSPAASVNLLGQGLKSGPAKVYGLDQALKQAGSFVHIYGKQICKPGRKMGHVTVLDDDLGQAIKRAETIRDELVIASEDEHES